MKNVCLLSFLFFAVVLSSCKTDAERRVECEREAEKLANEFINNSMSNEDKQMLKNIYNLIKENAVKSECKELKHTKGGNDPEALNLLIKDYVNIAEVEHDNRYEQYQNKESDAILFLGYQHTSLSYFGDISFYLNKDSIAEYLKKDIYDGEEVENFIESARERMSYLILEGRSALTDYEVPALSKLRKYEYIGFVESEYEYPPIITNSGEFESGVACAHLKIFRIKDKTLILDKRIFATSSSELEGGYIVDLVDEYGRQKTHHVDTSDEARLSSDLAKRLNSEVVLQAIKAGVPYQDYTEEAE